jgi:hypothetical protein
MRFRSADRLEPDHIGKRVTVRRLLPDGSKSDVIGILESLAPGEIVLRRADGEAVHIDPASVVAARVVSPPS